MSTFFKYYVCIFLKLVYSDVVRKTNSTIINLPVLFAAFPDLEYCATAWHEYPSLLLSYADNLMDLNVFIHFDTLTLLFITTRRRVITCNCFFF